ncbi:MAG: pyruvate, phosphate dikinase [Candidatus Lambdaproteobacteria bacterium RIFOXYD1_FULL_56_27]|uniref:Pyruvate, phosphate dikinase n=1 Tax=Candidatus Lambdaproteobacteria bacterium RIFOXYD2_FULL_56_26 TaxID=1817773 RepID=A0A1F6GL99_9PROT|nr:MAG: pyruvate, phosphate dikinase [Candidatus Lambdaproteobacteria bacterium RIFOXYD2_FULL_56_26]OGH03596.1 MAG: pyruvate, phosphate dikinase [Candidatus Lambdaproteobacteria bacterium RIFOXYC1_FULL_56_13]OGH08733.1 MAG: pyruvate, phosphate dikinase [Candidatus Lambdaproteobacteria bacterium RIFOXYD1_FULL_56_27]
MGGKFVYRFGKTHTEGNKEMKQLLGGKGANLAEMSRIGLPVPPGFTISTEACARYHEAANASLADIEPEIRQALTFVEQERNQALGDPERPLLVSVRSGAAVSMPGMMDTVLNLGLNPLVVEGLAKLTQNPRFAWDLYRRFIDMFGDVVMGVSHEHFEEAIGAKKREKGVIQDNDLTAADLEQLCVTYLEIYKKYTGKEFPFDPWEQLIAAIEAVFRSWDSDRAVKYRRINHVFGLLGTAVNVQSMVYGNKGENSGTGVLFTRNPSTGENKLYGEYLINAQGEDVVAGIRTPSPIDELQGKMPGCYGQILDVTKKLERHYKTMQDIEFTIEDGELFILQTRTGKCNGIAAVRMACEMVDEGMVEPRDAVQKLVEPDHLNQLLHPHFADEESYQADLLTKGLPASPGAAVGRVVFTSEAAEAWKARGEKVIMVRVETSPDDVGGMHAAQGILTARGGMTSHAAVVARGWGKCCISGCNDLEVDEHNKSFKIGAKQFHEGDWLSLNGTTGEVIQGAHSLKAPEISGSFARFMGWVDQFRKMGVRTNAETPSDAKKSLEFGAEGIGLCRTEHMFFAADRILHFREMILSESEEQRKAALALILPFQRQDFFDLFKIMDGRPVNIRLLDPPLHEFLPKEETEQRELAKALHLSYEAVKQAVEELAEVNPMLGFRGCRLGIVYPEITAMQARAIFEAALELKATGKQVFPEVMVPLVGGIAELEHQTKVIRQTAQAVFAEKGDSVEFKIGTMIEIPRAALRAGEIAKEAEYFSFGTNDLTQMTFGYSRDDVGKFLPHYISQKIVPFDPFQVLDQDGVGELVVTAVERGRKIRPNIKLGVCGEHGGDPRSVKFFAKVGMDYVSCSPFRVPIAKLAAAQAALETFDLLKEG